MRVKIAVLVALIVAVILSGCADKSGPGYQNISAGEMLSILRNEKEYVLVDVREPYELEETGFIQGAVNIPVGKLEKSLNMLPRTGKLLLYCRTGRRSSESAGLLSAKGYTNVYNLQGGIAAWPYDKVKKE
ncbi:MAG: rhodanese-like domain-containing protein [Desulfocucumaceae bacterium]